MRVSDELRRKAERERKRTKVREPGQQMPKMERAEVLRRRKVRKGRKEAV